MSKTKPNDDCMLAINGPYLPIYGDHDFARLILDISNEYFKSLNLPEFDPDEIIKQALDWNMKNPRVITHIGVNEYLDMVVITLPLKTEKEINWEGYRLGKPHGDLCYGYNVTIPEYSEHGPCVFKNTEFGYRRIG